MKRLFVLTIMVIAVFILIGCGSKKQDDILCGVMLDSTVSQTNYFVYVSRQLIDDKGFIEAANNGKIETAIEVTASDEWKKTQYSDWTNYFNDSVVSHANTGRKLIWHKSEDFTLDAGVSNAFFKVEKWVEAGICPFDTFTLHIRSSSLGLESRRELDCQKAVEEARKNPKHGGIFLGSLECLEEYDQK